MKFTKILILILALSMLLVSCGGNGDGTVTTEPDDPTYPECGMPDDRLEGFAPEPSGEPEYFRFGDELINMFETKLTFLEAHIPNWCKTGGSIGQTAEEWVDNYSDSYDFIIQFTAIDHATSGVVYEGTDEIPRGRVSGTVDKIHFGGDNVNGLVEGQAIDMVTMYGIIQTEDGSHILATTVSGAAIFRKGYSYIVCGTYFDDFGEYRASCYVYELSLYADQSDFNYYVLDSQSHTMRAIIYSRMRDSVLDCFPPVEPTKLEN